MGPTVRVRVRLRRLIRGRAGLGRAFVPLALASVLGGTLAGVTTSLLGAAIPGLDATAWSALLPGTAPLSPVAVLVTPVRSDDAVPEAEDGREQQAAQKPGLGELMDETSTPAIVPEDPGGAAEGEERVGEMVDTGGIEAEELDVTLFGEPEPLLAETSQVDPLPLESPWEQVPPAETSQVDPLPVEAPQTVSGIEAPQEDQSGKTPLHWAVQHGYTSTVEILIGRGENVNGTTRHGDTPLHLAAWWGHAAVAELLLAKAADVNARDEEGFTPLHRAARQGHADVARLLLSRGADVNARNCDGQTPLHCAISCTHQRMPTLLIARGADVNAQDNRGRTPVHLAAGAGRMRVLVALLDEKADFALKDKQGRTALDVAIEKRQAEAAAMVRWRMEQQ